MLKNINLPFLEIAHITNVQFLYPVSYSPKVIDAKYYWRNWEPYLDKIFVDGCETHNVRDKYISPSHSINDNAYFVVDLGMILTLKGVKMKNLQNADYHDRF